MTTAPRSAAAPTGPPTGPSQPPRPPAPPYRPGQQAVYFSYEPLRRQVHLRLVTVKSCVAVPLGADYPDEYDVTIRLLRQVPSTPDRNLRRPPGRPPTESRRPAGRKDVEKRLLDQEDAMARQIVSSCPIRVDKDGVGAGLVRATPSTILSLRTSNLDPQIVTQIASTMLTKWDAHELWTAEETADFLRMPLLTLYGANKARNAGDETRAGPPYAKLGRHCVYPATLVRQWVWEHMIPEDGWPDRPRPRRGLDEVS